MFITFFITMAHHYNKYSFFLTDLFVVRLSLNISEKCRVHARLMPMTSRYNWRNVHISSPSLGEGCDRQTGIEDTLFPSVNLAFAVLNDKHRARKFTRHIIPANVTLEWLSLFPACCNYSIISFPIMS